MKTLLDVIVCLDEAKVLHCSVYIYCIFVLCFFLLQSNISR